MLKQKIARNLGKLNYVSEVKFWLQRGTRVAKITFWTNITMIDYVNHTLQSKKIIVNKKGQVHPVYHWSSKIN